MPKRNALNLVLVLLTSLALSVGACSGGDDNGEDRDNEQNNESNESGDAGDGGDDEDAYNPCEGNEPNDTECDGECVDTDTNEEHCGACGQRCPTVGLGEEAGCFEGSCECGDDELTYCEGTNSCTHLDRDRSNCGECGNDCGDDLCWTDECMSHAERLSIEINEYRENGEEVDCIQEQVDPVDLNDDLSETAQEISQEFIDTDGQVESDPAELAADKGYEGEIINVAPIPIDQELPERFFEELWIEADDPALCELLMDPEATDLGVGMVFGTLEGEDQEGNPVEMERFVWTVITGK